MALVLLSHNTPDAIVTSLYSHGFEALKMPSLADMAPPVSSHPDMLLFCGFGKLFVRKKHLENFDFAASVEEILKKFPTLELSATSDLPSETYPDDIAFNCLHIKNRGIFGKADYLSGAVKRAATENMLPVIDVSQGYTKCSSLLVDGGDVGIGGEDALVITSDPSINRSLSQLGINTLKLAPGNISLPGYDTGFIGGASFYYNNTIYFLGDLKKYPECDIILKTAEEKGKSVVSLSDEMLFDAGCLLID